SEGQADLFEFDKRHYDVIILGDMTARQLSGGNPRVLARIADEVRKKGTGLMMMGGLLTFGNSDWRETPIAETLPGGLDATGHVHSPVQRLPTAKGLDHYLLRLSPKAAENTELWRKLPPLEGMTRMGTPKPNARIYARANDAKNGEPMLVALEAVGEGR